MKFFGDENFAIRGVRLLEVFDPDNSFCHLTDHFPRGTPDLTWIPAIGAWHPRPIILGGDGRILKNAVERRALRDSGCMFIYLASGWTNTPWELMALRLIKYWPKVRDMADASTRQAVFELKTGGALNRENLSG